MSALRLTLQRIPMLRLLIPFLLGIAMQHYFPLPISYLLYIIAVLISLLFILERLSVTRRFQYTTITGLLLFLLLFTTGSLTTLLHNITNQQQWFGKSYEPTATLILALEEPLVEKPNSYKALARVTTLYHQDSSQRVTGQVLLYFKKDSTTSQLNYGSQIITAKPLQEIRNAGNPGSFDFKQYSLYQGTTHQLYLTATDYHLLAEKKERWWKKAIYTSRENIITLLRHYITGEKEQGLAEALLIGYKDDLDKKLVQSYSNTGVVHVIAISGLHLGIIYWLLLFITKPLNRKRAQWLRFALVVTGLWAFSFLAGAQPSILRSAVMFSCLAFSVVVNRQSSMYNTLALSAFVLLCINPFWLWDVGFQLSYSAVLSILLFYKPIYHWFYFPNKLVDAIWKLAAVSLAAQLLTLPISVYYFHQFPIIFLISNLVAVPLSSLILIGEILLCCVSWLPPVAAIIGQILFHLLQGMNTYVERLDTLPFAVWSHLSISPFQTFLLYLFIAGTALWLLEEKQKAVWVALGSLLLFNCLRTMSFITANQQRKLIVYNIPKHSAIDIIRGRELTFIGDTVLVEDDFLRNFHLQPSRIQHRIQQTATNNTSIFNLNGKHIVLLDTAVQFVSTTKPNIDILVLSHNPKLYLKSLASTCHIKQLVLDGSVPHWKANLWKKDAAELQIPCYDVSDKGAFVMNF